MTMAQDIDRKTASKLLGVSIRTIDRYIRNGKISVSERMGRIYIDRKEIERLQQNVDRTQTTADTKRMAIPVRRVLPAARQERRDSFYRDLYEEAISALKDYHQKLEQANYRIGQLESQALHNRPAQIEKSSGIRQQPMWQHDIQERDREIIDLKDKIKQEKMVRFTFAVLTYILIGLLPLIWYILR